MNCPNCNSKNVVCICLHHNRRKKLLVYVMKCQNCKKRYTEEGEKKLYDHTGNSRKKNHLCYQCRNKLDNDTEKVIGQCFDCIVSNYVDFNITSFDDHMFYLCDFDEFMKQIEELE